LGELEAAAFTCLVSTMRTKMSENDTGAVTEYTVDSFEQFHSVVSTQFQYSTLYRGMKDIDWKLTPSFGRYWPAFKQQGADKREFLKIEGQAIRIFRKQSAHLLGYMPEDGWEVWSIAQHHGLPIRLLDWTLSPLVGLFFAVEEPWDGDSVVYALKIQDHISLIEEAKLHPLGVDRVTAFEPSHQTPRVRAQSAMFTIQPDPTVPLWAPGLQRVRIKNAARSSIMDTLFAYGITRKMLFPELDGLAEWLIQLKLKRGW
jgi:hypothetical protein